MRVAALDLGSNTSLLLIANVEDGQLQVVHDETTITRMGQGVHATREFHVDALARLEACFANYRGTILRHACDKVIAVATSAARDMKNAAKLLELGHKYDIPIHVVSGLKEAELTFNGALSDWVERDGLAVIDVGGGSTEIISRQYGQLDACSVDIGSVRLSELFVKTDPIANSELDKLRAYIETALEEALMPAGPFHDVVAVAGTPTTLAALDQAIPFQENLIHHYRLTMTKMKHWLDRLSALPADARAALPGMQPGREDVIVPGVLILQSVLHALNKNEMIVSTRGVRYGVALAWEDF